MKTAELCLLNIGNSRIQRAFFSHDMGFSAPESLSTADFHEDWIPEGVPAAAASVVPALNPLLKKRGVFVVSSEKKLPLDFSGVDLSTIGADRLANAAALLAGNSLPALCIDCGTAINLELVDSRRCFRGGAILPGRMLMRKALNDYTAKLPLIGFFPDLASFPGTNTCDALRLGTDGVLTDALRSLIRSAEALFPGEVLSCTVCGGDRHFFRKQINGLKDGGEDFTLHGIKALWDWNHEN